MEPFVLPLGTSDRIRGLGKRLDETWEFDTYHQIERTLRTGGLHGVSEAMENGSVLACTHIGDGVYGWCLIPQPVWMTKPVSYEHPEMVKGVWKLGKKNVTQKFYASPLFLKIRYGTRRILTLSEQEWTDLHSLGRRLADHSEPPVEETDPYEDLPTPETDPLAEMSRGEIDQLADEIFNDGAPNG